MKNLILIPFLFISALTYTQTSYYCAPADSGGSDSNPGTLLYPFATWEKLGNALSAGDIGYIRGGIYKTFNPNAKFQCHWDNLYGTEDDTIKIWAYPGETPIWDLQGK